jgi:hypothetical protein
MPILSDSDLADLADLASDLALADDCTIERNSVTSGQIDSTVIEIVKALASIRSLSPQSFGMYESWQGNLLNWHVLLPLNTNVKEGDVLTIKGQRMEVQKVIGPRSYAVFDEVEASGVKT